MPKRQEFQIDVVKSRRVIHIKNVDQDTGMILLRALSKAQKQCQQEAKDDSSLRAVMAMEAGEYAELSDSLTKALAHIYKKKA